MKVKVHYKVDEIVPELSENIHIYPSEDDTVLIHEKKYNLRIRVNLITHELLKVINGKLTIKEIVTKFNSSKKQNITSSDLYYLLYGSLARNGIIKSKNEPIVMDRTEYLRFRIPLFKEKQVYKISHIFAFLFNPIFFYYSLIGMLIFISTLFFYHIKWDAVYDILTPKSIIYFYFFTLFVTLMHELGHASACRKFGALHGDIGVAFYIFTPVFYADVSDAWKLSSSKRVIIDFAGLYMEILVSTFLSIIFLISGNVRFLIVAFFIIIHTYSNLNPFLRFDGYWAVADWMNIPNLRKDSNLLLKRTLRWILKKGDNPLRKKGDLFLVIYGFLSVSFIILFLTVVLLLNANSVLYFPYNLFLFLKTCLLKIEIVTFSWLKGNVLKLILPFSFYLVVGNVLIKNRHRWKSLFKF